MTPKQSLSVIIRLFALWLIVEVMDGLFEATGKSLAHQAQNSLYIFALYSIAVFILGVYFLRFPSKLASWLLRGVNSETKTQSSIETWFVVGCALLSLWLFGEATPRLLAIVFVYKSDTLSNPIVIMRIIAEFTKLSFAIAIAVGGRQIFKMFTFVK